VSFKNYDSTLLESDTVAFDGTVTYQGSTPTRPNDEQYTYTFSGWSGGSLTNIKSDLTLTATFSTTYVLYSGAFQNYEGTELENLTAHYGDHVSYTGATPTHPDDDSGSFSFSGWDKDPTSVVCSSGYVSVC